MATNEHRSSIDCSLVSLLRQRFGNGDRFIAAAVDSFLVSRKSFLLVGGWTGIWGVCGLGVVTE